MHHVREKCLFFFFKFTELLFVSLISPWMASSLRAHAVIPPVDICQEYTKTSSSFDATTESWKLIKKKKIALVKLGL